MESVHAFLGDETGVSRVIGIVLLVAITVTLVTVVGLFFIGAGQQEQVQPPTVSIDVDAHPGPDGTFSDSGNGGLCVGGTYEDDDQIDVEISAGDILSKRNVDIVVGSTKATMASCAGGDTGLDYLTTVPSAVTAGISITIAEAKGNNAIREGATVRVVWRPPNVEESFTIHRSTIGA